MSEYYDDITIKLFEIAKKYNTLKSYNEIILECNKKIMSKGKLSLYGMYFPKEELSNYFIYKGKITKNEKNKDFEYYFDDSGKLRITKRYSNNELLDIIYYNYMENDIEIYWYNCKRNTIHCIGYIEYNNNNKLVKFVESSARDIIELVRNNENIKSYIEYTFEDDYIFKKIFATDMYSDGRIYEKIIKIPR